MILLIDNYDSFAYNLYPVSYTHLDVYKRQVMCFLSVVVHGVRLNVLEFSGQAGLEWTGVAYEPFKVNDKIEK